MSSVAVFLTSYFSFSYKIVPVPCTQGTVICLKITWLLRRTSQTLWCRNNTDVHEKRVCSANPYNYQIKLLAQVVTTKAEVCKSEQPLAHLHWYRNCRRAWWCCVLGSPASVAPKAALTNLWHPVLKHILRASLASCADRMLWNHLFIDSLPPSMIHLFLLELFPYLFIFINLKADQSLCIVWMLPGWHWHLSVNNLAYPGGRTVVYVTLLNSLQQD